MESESSRQIRSLFEKAARYIASADLLLDAGDLDSAVSRSYYAMFYCSEALLFSRQLTFSSHRGVHSSFAQQFIKSNELPTEMHEWLINGFAKRQISDYDAIPAFTADEVRSLNEKALKFLELSRKFVDDRSGTL